MQNYYRQEVFDKVSQSNIHLHFIESVQKNAFAYIANKFFGQSIPLDVCEDKLVLKLFEHGIEPERVKFNSLFDALALFNKLSNIEPEMKPVIQKYAKPFIEQILEKENFLIKVHSFMIPMLNDNKNLTMSVVKNQQKYLEKSLKEIKREGVNIPLRFLKDFKVSKDSYSSDLLWTINAAEPLFDNPNKTLLKWWKTLKEQKLFLSIGRTDEVAKSIEEKIKNSGEKNVKFYNEYTTLSGKSLVSNLNSFLSQYSFSNLEKNDLTVDVMAQFFDDLKFKGLKVIDSHKINNFFYKHFNKHNFPEEFVEDYFSKIMDKEYKNADSFIQDVRKVAHLLSFYSHTLDYATSSTDRTPSDLREDALNAVYGNILDWLSENKSMLSEKKNVEKFIEAICLGTTTEITSAHLPQVWEQVVRNVLNGGEKSVIDILVSMETHRDDVGLSNVLEEYSNKHFNEMAIPILKNIHKKYFSYDSPEKNKYLALTGNSGVLKRMTYAFPKYGFVSTSLELTEANILEAVSVHRNGDWSNEQQESIDAILGRLNHTELVKNEDFQILFSVLMKEKVKHSFTLNADNWDLKGALNSYIQATCDVVCNMELDSPLAFKKQESLDDWKIDYNVIKNLKAFNDTANIEDKVFYETLSHLMRMPQQEISIYIAKPHQFALLEKIKTNTDVKNGYSKLVVTNICKEDPYSDNQKMLNAFSLVENCVSFAKYAKSLREVEFLVDEQVALPLLASKVKTNHTNAFGILRYQDVVGMKSFEVLNAVRNCKPNTLLMASGICSLEKKRSQGNLRIDEFGFFQKPMYENDEIVEVGKKVYQNTYLPDFSILDAWDFRHFRDNSFINFYNAVTNTTSFMSISDENKNKLKSLEDDFLISFSKDEMEFITSILAEQNIRDMLKEKENQIFSVFNNACLNKIKDEPSIVEAMQEACSLSVEQLNNMVKGNFSNNLNSIKDTVLLKLELDEKMGKSLEDNSSGEADKISFKL